MEDLTEEESLEKAEQLRSKYLIIRDLCFLLQSILPQEKVMNQERKHDHLLETLSSTDKGLFLLLLKQMTLLNKMKRVKEKGYWQCEEEDILLALYILGEKINPIGFIKRKLKKYYLALENYYGNSLFTRDEAMSVLGLGKTQSCLILNKLTEKSLLYQHKRTGDQGYLYQIMKSLPQNKNTTKPNPKPKS